MKQKIIMYVFNDITTDARVLRAADALSVDFDLSLISTQKGKDILDGKYKNILVGGHYNGFLGIFESVLAAYRVIRKQKPEMVYCHDYYSAILAYFLIISNYSGKIIYDAHELMIPEKGQNDRRLNFFYWFEKHIIKKVNLIICASDERGEIMKKHYGLPESPFVVPNISQLQVNDNDCDVKVLLDSLSHYFSDSKYALVYAGVVSGSRCLDELLDTAISLSDRCKLLIIGKGDALESLKMKAGSHPELLTAFTGSVPYKCLGALLSRCDIGFLYYPVNTLNNIYCASNKVFEYASVGLPIIANENPTVKNILTESQIGISTCNFKEGIIKIISEINFYKSRCSEFTSNNQWADKSDQLLQKIKHLSKNDKE